MLYSVVYVPHSQTNQSPLGPPDLGHLMINSNCPFHPIPVDLPTSLPANIAAAISKVVVQFTEVINTTNLVSESILCLLSVCLSLKQLRYIIHPENVSYSQP